MAASGNEIEIKFPVQRVNIHLSEFHKTAMVRPNLLLFNSYFAICPAGHLVNFSNLRPNLWTEASVVPGKGCYSWHEPILADDSAPAIYRDIVARPRTRLIAEVDKASRLSIASHAVN